MAKSKVDFLKEIQKLDNRFIELFKKQRSMISEFYHASLCDKLALSRYSNLEERYQMLIA
jgi:hypothetical protein